MTIKEQLLDDLKSALRAGDDSGCADWAAAGAAIKTTAARWRKVFTSRGALKLCLNNLFNAVGADFDPHFHMAVSYEPADDRREGEVVEEFARGYMLGERLLRPAMVKVAKA